MKAEARAANDAPGAHAREALRGKSVTIWMAGDVAQCVERVARERQLASRNAAFVLALKTGLGALNSDSESSKPESRQKRSRAEKEVFDRLWFRSARGEKQRIEAFKVRHRHEDLSSAIADLITRALDAEDLGDNVPATKAEELEQQIREMRELVDEIGPGVFGILGLLSHWATQSGGLEVEEDELVEEALTAGQQTWATRQEIAADDVRENPILHEQEGP